MSIILENHPTVDQNRHIDACRRNHPGSHPFFIEFDGLKQLGSTHDIWHCTDGPVQTQTPVGNLKDLQVVEKDPHQVKEGRPSLNVLIGYTPHLQMFFRSL